jgi:hypothetical protein
VGILLAAAAVPILQHHLPPALNFRGNLHLDWAGAAFAVLLATITTLLAGTAPAWMSWRTQPQEALQNDSYSGGESHGGERFRKILVVAEVVADLSAVVPALPSPH